VCKFLDAVCCEKGPEIVIDDFQIQLMVKNDMVLEVNFFQYNDLWKSSIEE
jgi:hypothetical protein